MKLCLGGGQKVAHSRERLQGRGSGFSLEAPTGNRFLIRSRLLTDDELDALGT